MQVSLNPEHVSRLLLLKSALAPTLRAILDMAKCLEEKRRTNTEEGAVTFSKSDFLFISPGNKSHWPTTVLILASTFVFVYRIRSPPPRPVAAGVHGDPLSRCVGETAIPSFGGMDGGGQAGRAHPDPQRVYVKCQFILRARHCKNFKKIFFEVSDFLYYRGTSTLTVPSAPLYPPPPWGGETPSSWWWCTSFPWWNFAHAW